MITLCVLIQQSLTRTTTMIMKIKKKEKAKL